MTGPPATPTAPTSPSAVGQVAELRLYDIRWPDGRRFDSRRPVTAEQARMLVAGGICDEQRSPTGILRYLRLRRNPAGNRFASVLAQADFTTTKTGNLHEHVNSKRRGL